MQENNNLFQGKLVFRLKSSLPLYYTWLCGKLIKAIKLLRSEGTSGDRLVQLLWSARVGCSDWWKPSVSRQVLTGCRDGDSTNCLSNLFQGLTNPVMTYFVIHLCRISHRLICVYCLLFCHWIPLRRVWLFLLYSTPSGTYSIPPDYSLLQSEQSQFSQPFHIWQILQSFYHLYYPLLDLIQHVRVCHLLWSPESDTVIQMCLIRTG